MTRTFGNGRAARRRKSHFRPAASRSVTSRSGKAAASGIPGAPPPDPTSTMEPSDPATTSAAARLSTTCWRYAAWGSVIPVSPGASSSSSSHTASRGSLLGWKRDDDVAIRLGPLAARLEAELLQVDVNDLPLDGCHRLQADLLACRTHACGRLLGQRLERRLSACAVPG